MQILRDEIEDKKNRVRRSVLHNQAYVDLINAEIEVLQSVVAEIDDTESRKELAREFERKKSKDNPKRYKINVVS